MKNRTSRVAILAGVIGAFAAAGSVAIGQEVRGGYESNTPVETRPFRIVLPSSHLLGDWAGLRTELEDAGIKPSLTLTSDFAWNPSGGKSQGATQASSIGLSLQFDLDRIAGIHGGSVLVSLCERFGSDLSSQYIGNIFTVQDVYGVEQFHLSDVAYQQKLFNDRVEFRVGRITTADDFLVSPYNYLFMQQGFDGFPQGIAFNAPGMTVYPMGTWGALIKGKPTQRSYAMVGFYNGDPAVQNDDRHGVDFSLHGPLFSVGEIGYQINGLPGDNGLLGNYKAGVWYDDATLPDFRTGAATRGSWGFYGLFDQEVIPFGPSGSNRGLSIFGSVMFGTDPAVQQMPFFFTAGVAARGFAESRPEDWLGLGVVYGHFSEDRQDAQRQAQQLDRSLGVQDYEMAIELLYRFYLHEHSVFFQPDLQYIVRPGGTGNIDNALVLGVQLGINF